MFPRSIGQTIGGRAKTQFSVVVVAVVLSKSNQGRGWRLFNGIGGAYRSEAAAGGEETAAANRRTKRSRWIPAVLLIIAGAPPTCRTGNGWM